MDNKMTAIMRTQDWQKIDARHHLAPFTDYAALRKNGARVITQADGHYITDSDGHRILDAMAGLWCVNVGYGRQQLVDAASQQMAVLYRFERSSPRWYWGDYLGVCQRAGAQNFIS